MAHRNRTKRRYSFETITAPTKLEVLELTEKEGEITSARLAQLMDIELNHASRLTRLYWSEGLFHRERKDRRYGGIRYYFNLTETGRTKLRYLRSKLLTNNVDKEQLWKAFKLNQPQKGELPQRL